MQERLKQYLNQCRLPLVNEETLLKNKFHKRQNKLAKCNLTLINDDKSCKAFKRKIRYVELRIRANNQLCNFINSIIFSFDIPENIKPALSKYNTFFDRYTFYCDKSILNYDNKSLTEIVCCEILNAMQKGYLNNRLAIGKKRTMKSTTALMMYHIGLIKEKLWYGETDRENVYFRAINTYENFAENYKIFSPNIEAIKYINNRLLFDDPFKIIGTIVSTNDTMNVREIRFRERYWDVKDFSGMSGDHLSPIEINYFDITGDNLNKLRSNNRNVTEHRELINMADKLGGKF